MANAISRKNVLFLQHAMNDGSVMLRPIVDGEDMFAEYRNNRGRDPEQLLTPLSKVLLPTRAGHRAVIAVCECGVIGCGSLSLQIRRVGQHVVWEPTDEHSRPRETIRRTYRFELEQYLDAVDAAAEDRPGEGRGRRVARAITLRMSEHAELMDDLPQRPPGIDWVTVYPYDSTVVRGSVTVGEQQHLYEFEPGPAETDEQFAKRVINQLNARWLALLETGESRAYEN